MFDPLARAPSYARSHYNTAALVMTQIIQGAGGGIAATASQVGAQGSVPHQGMPERLRLHIFPG